MRVGIGYDVHRLVEGRELILGGVKLESGKGLLGHSDADVLCHAVIDALLGAAKKGDIGRWFPDDDERYRGASSLELLREAARIIYEDGWRVVNIDCVVCLNAPKIAGFAAEMERNMARSLNISPENVSVKGKTEEGLGATGAGEGCSAQAVCLLDRREFKILKT